MYQIQSTIPLEGYLETRIGGRQENQDACGFSDTPLGALILVCDGMGGHRGGSTASTMAIQAILDAFANVTNENDPDSVIKDAVVSANKTIMDLGKSDPNLSGMGTTLTLLLLNPQCAYVVHLGDSRVYQLRKGQKVFRTFDDSVVFQLVKSGALTEEQARSSPNSNVITKALGIYDTIEFDIEHLPYDKNDRFVLCTDGFWGVVHEKKLLQYLNKSAKLPILFESVLEKVGLAGQQKNAENYDNYTAAIIDVKINSKTRTPMERKLKILTVILAALLLFSIGVIISLRNSDKRLDRALDTKAIVEQNKDLLKSLEAISDSLKVKYDEAVLNDQKASASYDTAFKNNTLPKPEIRELKQAWDEAEKNVKDIKKQIEDNNIKISSVQGVLKKNSDKLKEQENSFEEVWNKLHKLKAPSGE